MNAVFAARWSIVVLAWHRWVKEFAAALSAFAHLKKLANAVLWHWCPCQVRNVEILFKAMKALQKAIVHAGNYWS